MAKTIATNHDSAPNGLASGREKRSETAPKNPTRTAHSAGGSDPMPQVPDWMQVIAHDLRSPLALVQGYVDLLQRTETEMSPGGKDMVAHIQRSTRRTLSLLDNLLTLAGVAEGKIVLKAHSTALTALCRAVAEHINEQAQARNIQLTWELPEPDALVMMDRIAVERILVNLISNAIKFSACETRVQVRILREADRSIFKIIDQGRGLSSCETEQVFKKFIRFPQGSEEGNGLGLTIAQTLARLHGGDITVESTPGKGSTFTVTLADLAPSS
ncbi:MAG: HAMP domain-containing histidine kinase [Deltaproteobacteria bacterium]|nr:HAMP domain-containing histidine kinase [Deltaproteobacteria bacterium]